MAAAINLRTLQRLDPGIEEILVSVCHVCLYEFSVEAGMWSKTGIDGPLHVYRKGRSHGFVILNRNNTNLLNEILMPDFEFSHQGQFLAYKDHSKRIFCIWFYDAGNAEIVYSKLLCAKLLPFLPHNGSNGTCFSAPLVPLQRRS